jgi:hypothetical protein
MPKLVTLLKPLPLLAVGGGTLILGYTAVIRFLQRYHGFKSLHNFWQPLVLLSVFLLAWGGINLLAAFPPAGRVKPDLLSKANRVMLPIGVFLLIFAAYHHLSCWLGWFTTLPQTYWDQLAVSFLHGKLYLENPTYFHDLTKFQGHWYVPSPPLPAFVLIPFVLVSGPEINVVRISVFFGALNALVLFFVLEQTARLGWIRLGQTGRLWVVALFAFGTPYLYNVTNAQMWFFSRTLTVGFVALAALAALRSWPAWIAGAFLAAAVCSRPDVAVLWPFLVAIYAQKIWCRAPRERLRPLFSVAVQSTLPILLAVAGLLYYNFARFGDWLDFGYVTINGAASIVKDAQMYGIFNPVFIPRNLDVMFLKSPEIRSTPPFFFLSRDGMSIFLTTPALLYLFRKQKLDLWKIGAIVSILINLSLLAMYHNTGSFQFGYNYLLDFIIPLLLILAAGLGEKTPRLFAVLVVLSGIINLLGAFWFMANS